MNRKSFVLASAAAALFATGATNMAAAGEGDAAEATIHCEGVNQCKGHSDCKTAENECKGMNSCKGKGFLALSEAECDAAKAAMEE